MNTILHSIDGRLRVRVPVIKSKPVAAQNLEQTLRKLTGVTRVKANAVTGSILIEYDDWRISRHDLTRLLGISMADEDTSMISDPPFSKHTGLRRVAAETMVQCAVQIGFQLLFGRIAGVWSIPRA